MRGHNQHTTNQHHTANALTHNCDEGPGIVQGLARSEEGQAEEDHAAASQLVRAPTRPGLSAVQSV